MSNQFVKEGRERPRQYNQQQIENRARDLLAGWLFEKELNEEFQEIVGDQAETITTLRTALSDLIENARSNPTENGNFLITSHVLNKAADALGGENG